MDAPYRPPDDELRTVIETLVGRVTAIGREENPLASSYPAEIVRCRRADGSELQLLLK